MRVGVRVGPVHLSTSTRSRRRGGSSGRTWYGKGSTTTPDGREVNFRCQHKHRSKSAALECSANIRKQIQHGRSLHLITRVRSTPASREAVRQRALKKEARHQAKANRRAETAAQRAEKRAAAKQRAQPPPPASHQQHPETQTWQPAPSPPYPGPQTQGRSPSWLMAQQRAHQQAPPALHQRQQYPGSQVRQPAAPPYPGPQTQEQSPTWPSPSQQQPASYQRQQHPERQARQPAPAPYPGPQTQRMHSWPNASRRSAQRKSLGWPTIGLLIAGVGIIFGFVLAGMAANKPHSALAASAGGLVILALLVGLVCAAVALWRWLHRRSRGE